MYALGVDTSNYATSLAVVMLPGREVVCAKKQFLPVKQGEAGLRQSEALFHHTAALPALLGELETALPKGALAQVAAVGVSAKPRGQEGSYMPCFLAGVSFAAAFAAARGLTPLQTSHQAGHVAAALYGAGLPPQQQALVFHASGGTTELLLAEGHHVQKVLGGTLDLYAGQAVDRLGVRLGFAFPAGEEISRLAETCEEKIEPKVSVKGMDFHLSGLQNQCEKLLAGGAVPAYAAKYCLLFIAKSITAVLQVAQKAHPALPVVCAGGVLCSDIIRRYLQEKLGEGVYFAPPALSADNAVGVALIAAGEV